jgi:spermidine synthase
LLPVFGLTLFLSAFLLFLVEPMVAKMVLPLLGGTPAVWNTCLVFFQAALLGGYAYAHWVPARLGSKRYLPIHLAILLMPALVLPLSIAGWDPPATENPVPWLITLLTVCVGLPFFVLATTAPLLQTWFSQSTHRAAQDPYFFYAASNLGSMAALLCYPTFVEPNLRLGKQSLFWSMGYGGFFLLTAACAGLVRFRAEEKLGVGMPAPGTGKEPPTGLGVVRWVALSAVPSSLMLGVTAYLTTDVAPVPLLWVLPLALYLLTFILAFSKLPRIVHQLMVALLPVAVLLLILVPMLQIELGIGAIIGLHLAAFFVAALVCHGELAMSRPPTERLTEFYLWISLGGFLGGCFNALIAPQVFRWVVEYPLAIVFVCFLRPHWRGPARTPARAKTESAQTQRSAPREGRPSSLYASLGWPLFGAWAGVLLFFISYHGDWELRKFTERNFFGVISVSQDPQLPEYLTMAHGTTIHGMQSLDPSRREEPLGYYHRTGPIGQVFAALRGPAAKKKVAVIGLGIGGLAAYARAEQDWTFYEIDPAVDRLARGEPPLFTYLEDCEARQVPFRVVLGDGRLQLARSTERYGLIVADAFSSDSIPVHLITREALAIYLGKLEDDGILAFHISSEYLHLAPVVEGLARDAGLVCYLEEDFHVTPAEFREGKLGSQWAVMVRRPEHFGPLAHDRRWQRLAGRAEAPVWTDDYSNLFGVLQRRESTYRDARRQRGSR